MALKAIVLFLVTIAVVRGVEYIQAPASEIPKLMGVSLNCVSETGVDADALYKIMAWKFEKEDNITKFMYCFLTKSGFADHEGHLMKNKIVPLVGNHKRKDEFAKVIDDCNKLDGKDKYDRVYKIAVCNHDKTPILFTL